MGTTYHTPNVSPYETRKVRLYLDVSYRNLNQGEGFCFLDVCFWDLQGTEPTHLTFRPLKDIQRFVKEKKNLINVAELGFHDPP